MELVKSVNSYSPLHTTYSVDRCIEHLICFRCDSEILEEDFLRKVDKYILWCTDESVIQEDDEGDEYIDMAFQCYSGIESVFYYLDGPGLSRSTFAYRIGDNKDDYRCVTWNKVMEFI